MSLPNAREKSLKKRSWSAAYFSTQTLNLGSSIRAICKRSIRWPAAWRLVSMAHVRWKHHELLARHSRLIPWGSAVVLF